MRPALLFLVALACFGPRPAAAAVRVDASGAWASPSGSLEAAPAVSLRGAISVMPQIFVGIEGSRSVHALEPGRDVTLEQVTLSGTWTLDAAQVVPVVSGVAGLLRVDGGAQTEPVYGLGAGIEWWPVRPLRGPTLAFEVRYLGLVDPNVLPFVTSVGLRAGWVF